MAKVAKPTSKTTTIQTNPKPAVNTSQPQTSGNSTVIGKGSPKLPTNPNPLPNSKDLFTQAATPNVLQANTNPLQNVKVPTSPVGDNEATRQIHKQSGNPIVGVRDFTAGKGYANAVDWDGQNVTIGGQIVKPMYVKDGTAYADTNSVLEAIKAYENQNGILTNKGVLESYTSDIKPRFEKALDKTVNRKPYNWNSQDDEALQKYIEFNQDIANEAMRKVLEENNTSYTGASGAVLAQAMAARDNYLDNIKAEYKDFEQRNYDRYLDEYEMNRNALNDTFNLGNDYYDKMYTANRDATDDSIYAGETERADQQRWFENDIIRQEQNRAERELAMRELLAPYEREQMKLTNEGLGLENTGTGIRNEGLGLENIGLGLKNEGLGLENIGLGLKNEELKESNRAAILQNREDEAVRRGFWLAEDEEFFPWLSKYRKDDGTYSVSPYYGEAMYNYIVNGIANQAAVNPALYNSSINSILGTNTTNQNGMYSELIKRFINGISSLSDTTATPTTTATK